MIQFTATARDIRTTSVSSLSAASGDFSIRIADKVLVADGKIQQPDIHPLALTGRMPLDIGQIIQTGSIPDRYSAAVLSQMAGQQSGLRSQNRSGHQGRRRKSGDGCERQWDHQTAGPGRKHPRNYLEVSSQDRYGSADRRLFHQYNFPARSGPNRAIERVGGWRSFWDERRDQLGGWDQSKI